MPARILQTLLWKSNLYFTTCSHAGPFGLCFCGDKRDHFLVFAPGAPEANAKKCSRISVARRTQFSYAIFARYLRTFLHAIFARSVRTQFSHAIFVRYFRTFFPHVFSHAISARYFHTPFSQAIIARNFRTLFSHDIFAHYLSSHAIFAQNSHEDSLRIL